MRKLLYVILSLVSIGVYGQTKTTNNIKKVDVMNIYGPNANIKIGEVKVYPTLESKVYLVKATVEKDTSGNYISQFYLGNNEKIPLFGVDIVLKFDQPIIRGIGIGSGSMKADAISADLKTYEFTASQINRPFGGGYQLLKLYIISKTKLKTTIEGINGELKQGEKP